MVAQDASLLPRGGERLMCGAPEITACRAGSPMRIAVQDIAGSFRRGAAKRIIIEVSRHRNRP